MDSAVKRDEFHFLELTLSNVRSFGSEQRFDFRAEDGGAARWCVILGENGVGKTTVVQALAMMRPVPAFERGADGQVIPLPAKNDELPDPDWVEPDVFDYQNPQILDLIRQGDGDVSASMAVSLVSATGHQISIGFNSASRGGKLTSASPRPQKSALTGKGPLIIGYGASRHTGSRNLEDIGDQRPTDGLFDDLIELADAEEVLETLYRDQLVALASGQPEKAGRMQALRDRMEAAIQSMMPDVDYVDASSSTRRRGGVAPSNAAFQTPSATVPLSGLSLGYRVMVSWIIDLAWRLHRLRPDDRSPFDEHAIVIVDEVDLHLHPRWQRRIRERLLEHFPNVQFIVTAHSPIVAQEAIANGDPVAVVRWNGSSAEVINDPLLPRPWRYDEILGSVAFGLETGVDLKSSDILIERDQLLRKRDLSEQERARLKTLNRVVHAIEGGDAPYDAAFDKLMERVVELERQLAERA
ncbi:AAA family ATPase [Sphingomonas sp. RHCKR7]|uniref:AAA family ATPase n=1 Tax=Sphingomonas folli TaxID=2862497 RepID=UPI001CA592CE|nr:AAA family ATPase [Sphingomonas folli]MBW6528533.1 AAA family ATPase [Sphingomonas folli]